MITINASTITNNLLSNNKFSYKITKQGYVLILMQKNIHIMQKALKKN